MTDIAARRKILDESRKRVRALVFGEPVTNVCAGEINPWRHSYFVKCKGDNVQLTDRRGKFGNFGCEVIYAGHLSSEECMDRFEPFWQAQFGTESAVTRGPERG